MLKMKLKNIIRYTLLAFVLAAGVANEAQAQDPEFTQYYANPLFLNPAFAGSDRCPRMVMSYRNQWPAMSGNYVTQAVSYLSLIHI